MKRWLAGLLLCSLVSLVQAEEFDFDISQYEKKPFELGGYLEVKPEYRRFNQDGALYQLNFPATGGQPSSDDRYSGTLELEGLYRFGPSSLNFRVHTTMQHDISGSESGVAFYELYYRAFANKLTFELGKRALKWGTGYAWNPVGFIQRRKDPSDPELSREGFVMASLDTVRSLDGTLQTVAFTPVLLPVTRDINDDFSPEENINLAGKLYLLYHDTDIDFLFLTEGSRDGRVGLDFSRNLAMNLEIHGELAWIHEQSRLILNENGMLATRTGDATSYLLGLRYLSVQDTTYILEYYHNGSGLSADEAKRFFELVDSAQASGDAALLAKARNIANNAGFVTPNYMRDYLHLRVTQKEPFGIVYLNADLTSIVNLLDHSYSFIPGLTYTGYKNTELRLRVALAGGSDHTEFSEKQVGSRIELRARYYF
ncbi:MAG: hypothetical protein ABFS45_09090 [Pseudomonadota bacterium]